MMIPVSKWDFIMKAVSVRSYLPGRIRLQSNRLVNNKSLSAQVYQYISSYKEIDTVEVNTVTVLLMYKPQILRSNRELAEIEHYIRTHVERRP